VIKMLIIFIVVFHNVYMYQNIVLYTTHTHTIFFVNYASMKLGKQTHHTIITNNTIMNHRCTKCYWTLEQMCSWGEQINQDSKFASSKDVHLWKGDNILYLALVNWKVKRGKSMYFRLNESWRSKAANTCSSFEIFC
jgi:hypothetical protein